MLIVFVVSLFDCPLYWTCLRFMDIDTTMTYSISIFNLFCYVFNYTITNQCERLELDFRRTSKVWINYALVVLNHPFVYKPFISFLVNNQVCKHRYFKLKINRRCSFLEERTFYYPSILSCVLLFWNHCNFLWLLSL